MNSSRIGAPKPRVSNSCVVLDASALLATILNETGASKVAAMIEQSVISAVNLSEVVARLQDKAYSDADADEVLETLNLPTVPFDTDLATAAGQLRAATRGHGLSFGDRACLALGRRLDATVLTADRAWADLDLGVTIEVIR